MSETTEISYAHHTASPWYGCTEVSPGCANCYARSWGRKLHVEWGKGKPRVRSKSFEANVRKWNRAQEPFKTWANYERPRIFLSLCDWLDPEVPVQWLVDHLRVMRDTPNLDHLLLTKRVELFWKRLDQAFQSTWDAEERAHGNNPPEPTLSNWIADWIKQSSIPQNIWFGVSCENQQTANERIPLLLQIPAKVRWVSAEPLLDAIDLTPLFGFYPAFQQDPIPSERLWVVVGGESGPKRRDCGVEAIVDVARQCQPAGVPVWVKQDCALKPGRQGRLPDDVWNLKQLPT